MADPSPNYKQLYLDGQRKLEDEQRKREEAERAQAEERSRREEEQRRREEEQRRREKAETTTRKTTLPEFLDACHDHLHANLTVQTDTTLSTRGDPANANNKLRPQRVRIWDDFPARQAAIWEKIRESDFALERHFTSVHTLSESGEAIQQRMMSSELDLHLFQRSTVEQPVSQIIKQMHTNPALRREFGLRGSVNFENHTNTLSPEQEVEEGMQNLSVSGGRRRRSPRLQAKANASSSTELPATARNSTSRSSRPRADQFCVYSTGEESRTAAFVIEYKAPHKIPLGYIYEGLDDLDLDDVVECRETESARDRFRRLVAAVITQAFSYMVRVGVEYGCVCTGEANIFLRVPHDPTTVYYFLSVPKGDVGDTTGWAPDADGPNRLHLTAVGQMLAFTLQALRTPLRSHRWRKETSARLKSWEVLYSVLLDDIPSHETPSSEYRPPRNTEFLRMSPVRIRQRRARTGEVDCSQPQDRHNTSDEEPDPDTPSRQPPPPSLSSSSLSPPPPPHPSRSRPTTSVPSSDHRSGNTGRDGKYCTQNCLLGLARSGPLDVACPNAGLHGTDRHQLSRSTFLKRIRQQLSEDLDSNCEVIGLHGACGVPFCVRLESHGYTVVAKACPIELAPRLEWEAKIYHRLRPIQGTHVPVHLGNIDLEVPYYYEGICELKHMMFLSYGGKRMDKHPAADSKLFVSQQTEASVQAVRLLGVLHTDLAKRNMLWEDRTRRMMVIDFERARIVEPRRPLGAVSANAKRKGVFGDEDGRPAPERHGALCELTSFG
ncbi:hypothetical protein AA0119_g11514 [Alternaria tenuissima]|uniref:Protein kinase domain-containing protein n=2 Tax=Alternaria alternata complex TaxID=187734 RepID=A0A4Q4N0Z3_ALTAL|nr:hypothetical protein AA0117_g12275 [Alternaria alternata]RYN89263.1 hypothetical protein AA0119_g11514 [Alternaria tenuissima]RYO04903.1 hypothetical protein AA0121_g12607 [Alternaria tenuissima]RYO48017.1 hypothetical protein AA0116_g12795 [Alternaria tenuissima]